MANPMETVERLLTEMKAAALKQDMKSHRRCSDELAVLVSAHMLPTIDVNWEDIHFTPTEAVIADLLYSKLGKGVSKDAIMNAVYYDRADGGPEMKIVDVLICKIRKKLHDSKSKFRIETIFGRGFRMVEGEGPRVLVESTLGKITTWPEAKEAA